MISRFLTRTCDHLRSDGADLTYVAYDVPCTPVDPLSSIREDYPNEKLFGMRQVFTQYVAFLNGDYLLMDSKLYAVRQVDFWDELFPMDDFYHLMVEEDAS